MNQARHAIGLCGRSRVFGRRFHLDSYDKTGITLSGLTAGSPITFRPLFLRDACTSLESVDVSTKQKTFSTGELSASVYADNAVVKDGSLHVKWSDGHASIFTEEFFNTYAEPLSRRAMRSIDTVNEWAPWKTGHTSDVHAQASNVTFADYTSGTSAVAETVLSLQKLGLAFVSHIPPGEKGDDGDVTVEAIGKRIGYIKNTFYGPSWNVVSVPDAKNVAYTAVYLPLHMDLLYYESPPGVQLLHVIENAAKGGESLFADSYAACLDILKTDPAAYDALTAVPISYHYVNDNQHYYYSRPLIVEDPNGPVNPATGRKDITSVNYSPPFQAPLDAVATTTDVSSSTLADFHRGLQLFEKFISAPSNQIEVKMEENTCVLFMNRRILHGRRQFLPNSGRRWFKGTYLDIDAFHSSVRTAKASI